MSSPALSTRVFIGTAIVLVAALGGGAMLVRELGERAATREARAKIAASASTQNVSQQQRFQQLGLLAEIVVGRPDFRAGLLDAIRARDRATLLERLEQRRSELGYDLALVLDADGVLAARTDLPEVDGTDLSARPLVRAVQSEFEAAGVWREAGRLFEAVAVPLAGEEGLFGYLALGYEITDVRALEVKRGTGSEAVFLADPRADAIASSLSPAQTERVLAVLGGAGGPAALVADGRSDSVLREVRFGGGRWLAQLLPLRDAGEAPIGVGVSIVSLDRELASYRMVRNALLFAAVGALLAALLFSLLVGHWVSAPARELARATAAARAGRYDLAIRSPGSGEMAALADETRALLDDRRIQRDTAELVGRLASGRPDSPREQGRAREGREVADREVVLLGVELRRHLRRRPAEEAAQRLERFAVDLRRIAAAVEAKGGVVEALHGHRIVASFTGAHRSVAALAATAEIGRLFGSSERLFDDADPPAAALAAGDLASGPVQMGETDAEALIGLSLQKLEALLRETGDGEIVIASAVHGELAGAIESAGVDLRPQRGLLSTRPLYLLGYDAAERVALAAGPRPEPAVDASRAGGGQSPPAGLAPGASFGERFEIVSMLGAGPSGSVVLARDRELDDLIALRTLSGDVRLDGVLPPDVVAGLELLRSLRHPNVLRVLDFGEIDGRPFVSMDYVRGVSLRPLCRLAEGLPMEIGLRLARQLAAGLGTAHERGIAHGDLRPENVFVDLLGDLRLADFDVASPGRWGDRPQSAGVDQLRREDVHACGDLLHELFTGRALVEPVAGADDPQTRADLPPALGDLLNRCRSGDPDDLPRDAGALLEELEQLQI
jgi:serine/threonine-protein kinase